jgi:hypothetical protein
MIVAFPALAAILALAAPPVEGDYLEDRSNHVYGCYCEWSGESVTGGTLATLAFRFTAGAHEGVSLKGTSLVLVLRSDETLSQGHPPRKSVLILDQRATPAQRNAASRWLLAHFPRLPGEILEQRIEPIRIERHPHHATLEVPELIRMEVRRAHPPEDSLPGSILWYDPFIPLTEAHLGTTLHNAYQGNELEKRWDQRESGVRGYFGRFRLPPPSGNTPPESPECQ